MHISAISPSKLSREHTTNNNSLPTRRKGEYTWHSIYHKDFIHTMKKWLAFLCIIPILLFSFPLYSRTYSPKTINIHSPLYEETDLLYRVHGLALPSGARPWSTSEAALILSVIPDGGSTAELKKQALLRLETTLPKQGSNGLSHRFSTTVAMESYVHTNTTEFLLPQDWAYSMDRRLPLLDFRMELQWDTAFYFATSVEAGSSAVQPGDETLSFSDPQAPIYGVGAIVGSGDPHVQYLTRAQLFQKTFNTNLMTFAKEFQANWPRDSQMTLGGTWWNLSLGRGPIKWGVGQSGNLVIGDHIDSHNNLNISFFSEEFKLQLLYLFLPNPVQDPEQRVFMGHRLETQPRPWLRLAFTENVMFKGESLPLTYIDPTYIYHNHYNNTMLNALASAEIHLALASGLSLHAQFALDQFQFSNEGGGESNAAGQLFGVTHTAQIAQGFLSTTLEFVRTDPSLYRRNQVDFLLIRGLKNNGNPMQFDYLGYKWGSDSIALSAEMVYLIPGVARYALSALIHRQGSVGLFGPHYWDEDLGQFSNTGNSNISGPPLSGDILKDQVIITFAGSWWLKKAPVRIFGELSWIGKRTYTKSTKESSNQRSDLQLVTGALYTF